MMTVRKVDRAALKWQARENLRGRVFLSFLATLIPSVLPQLIARMPINLPFWNLTYESGDQFFSISIPLLALGFLVSMLVTSPIQVTLGGYFIRMHRNPKERVFVREVFDCFGKGYWRLVVGMLLSAALSFIISLLGSVVVLAAALLEGVIGASFVTSLIMLAAYIFCMVASLYFLLGLQLVPYLLYDRPELTARQVIRQSLTLMRRRRWELFVLGLSFVLWIIFSVITMGFAVVFVAPYIYATLAGYYVLIADEAAHAA